MNVIIASLNTAIERLLHVESQRPGEVHRLLDDKTLAGGKGVNVARVLRQLNAHLDNAPAPKLVGFLGGATGRLCRELLEQEDLPGSWCEIGGSTRICEVVTEQHSPNLASVYNACGPEIQKEELARLHSLLGDEIQHASALVCTGSMARNIAPDEYGRWVSLAKQSGVLTLLDTHGSALLQSAGAAPDIIKINQDELRQANEITGHNLPADWLSQGVSCVIITNGLKPTLALTPDGNFEIISPTVNTVSSVGSGDAYCAGLIASLLARHEAGWQEHLTFAAACGAANAASPTAGLAAGISVNDLQKCCRVRAL